MSPNRLFVHLQVSPFLAAAQSTSLEVIDFYIWFSLAFWCNRGKHIRIPCAASRDQIHIRLRFCCDSVFICIFFRFFRHHFKTIDGTEMAHIEQTKKIVPLITCEISIGQYVCELVFGVNVFDLDSGVQINSIEKPIKSNFVGSGNMSHCRASSLLWSSWSLPRYLQTHTTKLPDEKNWRMRK